MKGPNKDAIFPLNNYETKNCTYCISSKRL